MLRFYLSNDTKNTSDIVLLGENTKTLHDVVMGIITYHFNGKN